MFSDTYFPQTNGVVNSIYNFSKRLVGRGHEVHVFAPSGSEHNKSKKNGIKVHEISSMPLPFYSEEYKVARPLPSLNIFNTFRERNFDIIHSHSMFGVGFQAYLMARIFDKPLLGSFHTLIPEFSNYITEKKEEELNKLGWAYCRLYYNKLCDFIAVPTDSTKNILEEKGFKDGIYTLPNGIDLSEEKRTKPGLIREKHDISMKEDLIIYLGRISTEKRIQDLIDAMEYLDENKTLLICGKGPYREKLEERAEKKENRIIFAGYVPEKLKGSYYNAADVFAFPSIGDTQGIVLLEAMKYGSIVVSVESQGIVDLIENGMNGLLAEPKNPRDLAEKIDRALENKGLRKKLMKGSNEVLKKHSWRRVTDKMESIYKTTVRKG